MSRNDPTAPFIGPSPKRPVPAAAIVPLDQGSHVEVVEQGSVAEVEAKPKRPRRKRTSSE